jgi:molecular chaperone DnaK
VKEAELHTEEDHRKKELAEARNQADSLTYTTQKTLTDLGDKVDPATKADIESRIATLKTAIEANDLQAIKAGSDELMKASHKLAEQMYAKAGPTGGAGGAGGAGGGPGEAGHEEKAKKPEEEVVEAEFEEVK